MIPNAETAFFRLESDFISVAYFMVANFSPSFGIFEYVSYNLKFAVT